MDLDADVVVPVMLFAIPVVAITGAILASVIRAISAHRLMEAAARERVALAARGVDLARLPRGLGSELDPATWARARAQTLLVWGLVLTAGGASLTVVSSMVDTEVDLFWGVSDGRILGVVAAAAGLALLASGAILWPRARHGRDPAPSQPAAPPTAG